MIVGTLRCAGSGVRRLHERDPSKVRSAPLPELLLDIRDPLAWRMLASRRHFARVASRAAATPSIRLDQCSIARLGKPNVLA